MESIYNEGQFDRHISIKMARPTIFRNRSLAAVIFVILCLYATYVLTNPSLEPSNQEPKIPEVDVPKDKDGTKTTENANPNGVTESSKEEISPAITVIEAPTSQNTISSQESSLSPTTSLQTSQKSEDEELYAKLEEHLKR